jgi:hypothetical protein
MLNEKKLVSLRMAKNRHEKELLKKANVNGVGIGYKSVKGVRSDELCIVIFVRKKLPLSDLKARDVIPHEIEGMQTDVVEVGDIVALTTDRRDRWRPAPGGVSIGHPKVTAGTLGTLVRDRETKQLLILSNNHVLANSNNAMPGDPTLQPGPADITGFLHEDPGNLEKFQIGVLERFIPIHFAIEGGSCLAARMVAHFSNLLAKLVGSKHRLEPWRINDSQYNEVDAAVSRPLDDKDVTAEIYELGTVLGMGHTDVTIDDVVTKSGRTTAVTEGTITEIEMTVMVTYSIFPPKLALFQGQIIATAMSEGGDSGSLVVKKDSMRAAGLLFAGSDSKTIINPINRVLDLLSIYI